MFSWSGETSAIAPFEIKRVVSKHAPMFSGFRQHDSQEFLAFLLVSHRHPRLHRHLHPRLHRHLHPRLYHLASATQDGLHEDVNLVTNKPYVEAEDTDGENESLMAAKAWERHLQRNRSKVVDLFQGQLKSTVVCPSCQKVSITFDPFLFLSLPLAATGVRVIPVTMV